MKTYVHIKPWVQMFMAPLFIMARTLDCSFPMSRGLLFHPPPSTMRFHPEASERVQTGLHVLLAAVVTPLSRPVPLRDPVEVCGVLGPLIFTVPRDSVLVR